MVIRKKRKIGSKSARAMLTWSHHAFQQRLISKAREYPWCKVLIVDENYTSKTCGNCGKIHEALGGNKHFLCRHCGFSADRDANAARNILIRFLTLEQGNGGNSAALH
jgi:putative transposase